MLKKDGSEGLLAAREFYFLRHGQTDQNTLKVPFTEERDIALNEHGKKQARALASSLALLPIHTICYSPLQRAKETMDLGAVELKEVHRVEISALKECAPHVWPVMTQAEVMPPASAAVQHFFDQVLSGVRAALAHRGPVLLVAHGGVHWALCQQLGVCPDQYNWKMSNGAVAHFTYSQGGVWQAETIIRPFAN